ncbi:MAG: DJ-1/PfpI family protein [Spirochaetia bacterium]|jgi:4-methyl-5(b-hydroxyethyl)-thiazole monophosphate biosynthesis|nr:DJ-1/PfpI family protein [Spirochaetia bacterium]
MGKKVLCILAEGFEEIEAVTPIDLLRRAGIEVVAAGLSGIDITGSHGITVLADCELDEADDDFDGVIIPGGLPGSTNIAGNAQAIGFISKMFDNGKLVAAICAAPAVVLGKAGILTGKKVTCAPGFVEKLPSDAVFTEGRVVTDKNIITSRGPGSAAEFAGAIITYFSGKETAEKLLDSTLYKR